ncbi:hypothetical protein JQ628_26640 [Bradyrhizobium lablabi]|uniref:hypothetical protein n=1 Tax=Bradyrhizobium lablabi TaxID=722472 RepID=UPI001BAC23CD|nr:hypothetical protein [Bradyrhizobium lablabi]MBR1125126.1 hypothetical protein [Bradyrhizobium lablabi]
MHTNLVYAAYGWLVFIGTGHFAVDVVSQYLRGKHPPGVEVSLYYGLHSAYALGQVVFGILALWIASHSVKLLDQWTAVMVSLAATSGWVVIGFLFMEHWEPKVAVAAFGLLVIAAAATA